MKRWLALAVAGSFAFLSGCASTPLPPPPIAEAIDQTVPPPPPDKAQIIFLQPFLHFTGPMHTELFELNGADRVFLKYVSSRGKAVVELPPGEHLFMSNGFGVSFMRANVEAGKRYYVLVRFVAYVGNQLRPIRRTGPSDYNASAPVFQEWLAISKLQTTTPDAAAWRSMQEAYLDKTQASAWESWNRKSPQERAELTLNPEDAIQR